MCRRPVPNSERLAVHSRCGTELPWSRARTSAHRYESIGAEVQRRSTLVALTTDGDWLHDRGYTLSGGSGDKR